MQKRRAVLCVLSLYIGAARCALGADDGEFSLGTGLNYSSGKYGTSTVTKILSIPFTARYDEGPWTLKLTVPYLRVRGPANVIPGIGRFDNSGRRSRRQGQATTTESGVGDTVASATYNAYYDSAAKGDIDVTARLKLPTADADRGLGTGSTDESFQIDLYKTAARVTLFGDLGYTFFGHSDFVQLQNAPNYGGGASYKLDATNSAGLSLDARRRVTLGGSPQRELTGFWNRRIDKARRVQAYVLVGLAKGSPDRGAGISAAYAF